VDLLVLSCQSFVSKQKPMKRMERGVALIMIKRVPGRKIPEPETLRNGQEQKAKNRTWRSKRRLEDRTWSRHMTHSVGEDRADGRRGQRRRTVLAGMRKR
jgi:hypothetical protein